LFVKLLVPSRQSSILQALQCLSIIFTVFDHQLIPMLCILNCIWKDQSISYIELIKFAECCRFLSFVLWNWMFITGAYITVFWRLLSITNLCDYLFISWIQVLSDSLLMLSLNLCFVMENFLNEKIGWWMSSVSHRLAGLVAWNVSWELPLDTDATLPGKFPARCLFHLHELLFHLLFLRQLNDLIDIWIEYIGPLGFLERLGDVWYPSKRYFDFQTFKGLV
jgi:hypothetical protein